MKIKTVAVNSISQDPANLRKHGERNIDAIVASLRKFGQQHPIVIDSKGIILSGNGRYMAAVKLGWHEIEVVESSLTGSSATAYAIADNRTAELAEWDTTALAETLRALQSEEFETDAAGYSESEIDALVEGLGSELLGADKEIVEDEVPEPPVDPITKAGDLWILGEHRLLCGDSTNADDVARLMDGKKADSIVTDPPYGIGSLMHGGTWATKQSVQFSMMREWDATTSQKFFDMIEQTAVPSVVWGGNYFATPPSRCWLAWDKPEFPTMSSVELAWTNMDKNAKRIECPRTHQVDGAKEHATQKPVRVMAWSLEFVPEGLVYDPFLGSGTTLIAAEQLGRKCYGMEISPQYCDVIVKRWENLTGMVAVRESA